jgi:ribosomal protein S27AE
MTSPELYPPPHRVTGERRDIETRGLEDRRRRWVIRRLRAECPFCGATVQVAGDERRIVCLCGRLLELVEV